LSQTLTAIQFVNVTKRYRTQNAVDNLSIEIRSGELFGFLGPNGAGKTTALKLAAGLIRPTVGNVVVAGYDIQREPLAAKRLTGYIPDNPFIYESLTGREFLHFCSGLYGLNGSGAERVIAELCQKLAIGDWIDQLVAQYSHGMKQRVVMASAFLHQPRVLLVDEPTVGLDPAGIRLVKAILKDFCRSGSAVFLSTHTLSDAEELCDRVGIIHKGRLIACGSVDEVRKDFLKLEDAFLALTN